MKIFKVESVIPNLLNRRSLEFLFANLEFHHEHHWTNEQHRVNPAAHAWNVKFQKQCAGQSFQSGTQEFDLLFPRSALCRDGGKVAICKQQHSNNAFR